MANYTELLTIATSTGGGLIAKITVACAIAAEAVRKEATSVPNHTARLAWAVKTLKDPAASAREMLWTVLAQNESATAAAITSATDAQVLAAVNASIDAMAGVNS